MMLNLAQVYGVQCGQILHLPCRLWKTQVNMCSLLGPELTHIAILINSSLTTVIRSSFEPSQGSVELLLWSVQEEFYHTQLEAFNFRQGRP